MEISDFPMDVTFVTDNGTEITATLELNAGGYGNNYGSIYGET